MTSQPAALHVDSSGTHSAGISGKNQDPLLPPPFNWLLLPPCPTPLPPQPAPQVTSQIKCLHLIPKHTSPGSTHHHHLLLLSIAMRMAGLSASQLVCSIYK